jgi:polyferredoxin
MVSLDVTKDRGLFRENAQGQIENIYSLKVINKTQQRQDYRLNWWTPTVSSCRARPNEPGAGEISDVPVSVAMLADKPASSSQTLRFKVTDVDEPWIYSAADSRFVAPLNR